MFKNNSKKYKFNIILASICLVIILSALFLISMQKYNTGAPSSQNNLWNEPIVQITISLLCSIFTGSFISIIIMSIDRNGYKLYTVDRILYLVEQLIISGWASLASKNIERLNIMVQLVLRELDINESIAAKSASSYIDLQICIRELNSQCEKLNQLQKIVDKAKHDLSEEVLLLVNKRITKNGYDIASIIATLSSINNENTQQTGSKKTRVKSYGSKEYDFNDIEDIDLKMVEIRSLIKHKDDTESMIVLAYSDLENELNKVKSCRDKFNNFITAKKVYKMI